MRVDLRGTMKTCAMLTVMTVVTVLAMNAQAHEQSCVSVEEHELAKRNLFRLNAEIWDIKAKLVSVALPLALARSCAVNARYEQVGLRCLTRGRAWWSAVQTGTTDDMKDIVEAAEKGKTYQGCPKCPKCPKRGLRHLLDDQVRWLRQSTCTLNKTMLNRRDASPYLAASASEP